MCVRNKVLFVDDQPHVLRALRRMFSTTQHWDVRFAASAEAALQLMEEEAFDVVVADMQMPGMDGAQLLEDVSKRHPSTARVVLSGEADRGKVLRVVSPMHQYLSKPCDPAALRSTIERVCALKRLLSQPGLRQLVSQVSSLPSVPAVYAELVEAVESPSVSVKRIGEIVSRDSAMTAKVLQLANSAIVGLRHPVSDPAQAASLLGVDMLKSLVLAVQAFSQFGGAVFRRFSIDQLLQHSLAVAAYGRLICKSEGAEDRMTNDAFAAGILHDVGKLVLAAKAADGYCRALECARTEGLDQHEAERRIFGADHAAVGAYLLGLWGLPQPVVEATAFHHNPQNAGSGRFSVLTAVHVANALSHDNASHCPAIEAKLCREYVESLGPADRLKVWKRICLEGDSEVNERGGGSSQS